MIERRLLLVLAGFAVAGACQNHVDSESRLLDDACSLAACTTSGSARKTSALTSDSLAFKLGRGAGKVVIPLPLAGHAGQDIFVIEALIEGNGTGRLIRTHCSSDAGPCTDELVETFPLHASSFDWVPAGSYQKATTSVPFDDFRLEVETGSSEELSLFDIRYESYDEVLPCSVYAPGRRGLRSF